MAKIFSASAAAWAVTVTKAMTRNPKTCSPSHSRLSSSSRSEEHTSELQSPCNLVCRLLLEKKKKTYSRDTLVTTMQLADTPTAEPRPIIFDYLWVPPTPKADPSHNSRRHSTVSRHIASTVH